MTPAKEDIFISETKLKLAAMWQKNDQLIEKNEKLKRRLADLELRIEVIQNKIERIKKGWKVV